ncbi:MAG TPA: flagellar basal body rod protein FlgC [Chthonomonadales bacterium]|nr:flagellar basal body rod protein FlgC [Chthonomonadales bacterium]
MGIVSSFEVSASGLTAERVRMDVISNNLANINTTRTATGEPFRRRHVVFASGEQEMGFAGRLRAALGRHDASVTGVRVVQIAEDTGPLKRVHNPGHPEADPATGFVLLPNVEPVMEMVDLIAATRAYDAGVSAIGAAKQMQQRALEIGRG